MAVIDEISSYKKTLRGEFGKSEALLDLLFNKAGSDPDDDEIDEKIYRFDYIPGTTTKAGSYIGIEIEPIIKNGNSMKYMRVYIYITVHKSLMTTPPFLGGDIRTDAITREVNRVILGSRKYGVGRMELIKMEPFRPSEDYYGRVVVYGVNEFNRMEAE